MKKILFALFIVIAGAAQAQEGTIQDTTKVLQAQNAYGYFWKNMLVNGSFRPPKDTFRLRLADTGAIVVINNTAYAWNLNHTMNVLRWDTVQAKGGATAPIPTLQQVLTAGHAITNLSQTITGGDSVGLTFSLFTGLSFISDFNMNFTFGGNFQFNHASSGTQMFAQNNYISLKAPDSVTILKPTKRFAVNPASVFRDTVTITTMGTADSSDRAASTAWVKRQAYGASGISLTAISALAPILYNNTTGVISADTSTGPTHLATQNYVTTHAGAGVTDLAYTPAATSGIVTSSTGTDATLPVVTTTQAGLADTAMKKRSDSLGNGTYALAHPYLLNHGTEFSVGGVAVDSLYVNGDTMTARLNLFTATAKGLVPASGGGSTNVLHSDGSWSPAGGGAPGGSNKQIQYNSSSSFAGSASLQWDNSTKTLFADSTLFTRNIITMVGDYNSNEPIGIEFQRNYASANLHTMMGVGGLGSIEWNFWINMDYLHLEPNVHHYYNSAADMIWGGVAAGGFFVQALKAGYDNSIGHDPWRENHSPVPINIEMVKSGSGDYVTNWNKFHTLQINFNDPSDTSAAEGILFYHGTAMQTNSVVQEWDIANLRAYRGGGIESGQSGSVATFKTTGENTDMYYSNTDGHLITNTYRINNAGNYTLSTGALAVSNDYNSVAYMDLVVSPSHPGGFSSLGFSWKTQNPVSAVVAERMFLSDSGHLHVNGLIESTTLGFKFPDGSVQTTAFVGGNSLYTADGSLTSDRHVSNAGFLLTFDQMQIGNTTQFDASYLLQAWSTSNVTRIGLNNNEANTDGNEIRFNKRRTGSYTLTAGDVIGGLNYNTLGSFSAIANAHTVSTFTNFDYVWTMAAVTTGTTTEAMRLNDSFHLTIAGMVESKSYGFKFPDGTIQTTASTGSSGTDTAHIFIKGIIGAISGTTVTVRADTNFLTTKWRLYDALDSLALAVVNYDEGTYTPTVSTATNVGASTTHDLNWHRVKNGYVVSGYVTITPTAGSTITTFDLSMPNGTWGISDKGKIGGSGAGDGVAIDVTIKGNTGTGNAQFKFTSTGTSPVDIYFVMNGHYEAP